MIASSGLEIIAIEKWTINEMELSREKLELVWITLKKYRTLFSDITRDNPANFMNTITSPGSMWFEVREHGVLVGIIWFGDMEQTVDCTGHMMFFDRRPAEKADLCKEMIKWMFANFPLHRITVTPPKIYTATVRLLEKIGLKFEGCKREAVLLGGKWNDILIYGITRSEVEML